MVNAFGAQCFPVVVDHVARGFAVRGHEVFEVDLEVRIIEGLRWQVEEFVVLRTVEGVSEIHHLAA
ncbi:Uncharacterised protein [Mycobacteroides abscessus]|nr:Uncharacterised protein [Mycobacteroides abscessus]SHU87615.1 Uncharacterised protein [Mycobacteroides abscessus subsp. abscessus]SII12288.1 Uncharacterised protein [Mycobacteroides abscessus subsp. abscessus]SIM18873.1 Uncharacterised protein [Mycobacteroides abscessus subsp. abscessus]SKV62167.1 Uncharacterised protein [Mycobacteroides abscessus subsp. abscessus]